MGIFGDNHAFCQNILGNMSLTHYKKEKIELGSFLQLERRLSTLSRTRVEFKVHQLSWALWYFVFIWVIKRTFFKDCTEYWLYSNLFIHLNVNKLYFELVIIRQMNQNQSHSPFILLCGLSLTYHTQPRSPLFSTVPKKKLPLEKGAIHFPKYTFRLGV